MSRAFVKEPEGDQVPDDQPRPKRPPVPHCVTPAGMKLIQERIEQAVQTLASIPASERIPRQRAQAQILDWETAARTAEVIDPRTQAVDQVRFGHTVTVVDPEGTERQFTLVGEVEADFAQGRIAYQSPLGQALLGAHVGDIVDWLRPAGDLELEIRNISIR